MVERMLRMYEVPGSIPGISTYAALKEVRVPSQAVGQGLRRISQIKPPVEWRGVPSEDRAGILLAPPWTSTIRKRGLLHGTTSRLGSVIFRQSLKGM